MYNTWTDFDFSSPIRQIKAGVELYSTPGSLEAQYMDASKLVSFTVERVGENNKFFGFGISQTAKIKILYDSKPKADKETKVYFYRIGEEEGVPIFEKIYPYPSFKIASVEKDENTGELTLTAHDKLYAATAHTTAELDLPASYTLQEFAQACAALLGLTFEFRGINSDAWQLSYAEGANLEGSETIREVLDSLAEATQTIYFATAEDKLVFKRLIDADTLTLTKADYITLKSGENRKLTEIVHATELGDNLAATTGATGVTQYIRNNPFLELREDIAVILGDMLTLVGNTTLNQFDLEWRGNFRLEIGDKLKIEDKEGNYIYSSVIDDVISYDGGLRQVTKWSYEENNAETATNSVSLGETLKQTYAKVDKANKQIDIVVSETVGNTASIAAIQANIDSISASVTKTQEETIASVEGLNEEVSALTTEVSNFKLESNNALLEFKQTIEQNGTEKVTTSTGYSLNSEGLKIAKSNSEINTTITEDGMSIRRQNEEVLIADNQGVRAEDLHATTYLIIGNNSRFEDWGGGRTACLWIGE